ncbi:hypothetical protein [Caulobacter mirabilis]|uniref:Protein activator of alkane oxidation PraB n=1 Tax=Caulobacter mirabilis TaxID=69666 RepID=A0A2D2AXS5_9CAUL|nr:hypothetical protein [Caulobacter mirabilis]ATQ42814.1 hypothetical protein CSW64_10545 [Caulobacter mirabilis]
MRKTLFVPAVSALALLAATAAQAATFSPEATAFMRFRGSVDIFDGNLNLNCDMELEIRTTFKDMNGDNQAYVDSASLSGGLCNLVSFGSFPYEIRVTRPSWSPTPTPATGLEIRGLRLTNVFGNTCWGDVRVDWWDSAPYMTFMNAYVPGGCTINGTLSQTGGFSLSITN